MQPYQVQFAAATSTSSSSSTGAADSCPATTVTTALGSPAAQARELESEEPKADTRAAIRATAEEATWIDLLADMGRPPRRMSRNSLRPTRPARAGSYPCRRKATRLPGGLPRLPALNRARASRLVPRVRFSSSRKETNH